MKDFDTIRLAYHERGEKVEYSIGDRWSHACVERVLVPPELRKELFASIELSRDAIAVLPEEVLHDLIKNRLASTLAEKIMEYAKIDRMTNVETGKDIIVAKLVIEDISKLGKDHE